MSPPLTSLVSSSLVASSPNSVASTLSSMTSTAVGKQLLDSVSSPAIAKVMNDSLLALLSRVLTALQGQSNLACLAVTSSGSTWVLHLVSIAPSSLVSSAPFLSAFGEQSFSAGIIVPSFILTFSTLADPFCSFLPLLPSHVANRISF